jgi:hypothetical protein
MANNRMYLLHKSSKKAVCLGKRLGFGWEGTPESIKQNIERLFDESAELSDNTTQDDFCIVFENNYNTNDFEIIN